MRSSVKYVLLIMVMDFYFGYAQSDFPYMQPDSDILSLADYKPAPLIRMKYDASMAVLLYRNAYKSIEEMSAPEMKLGGIRVNPITKNSGRTSYYTGMKILDVKTGIQSEVTGLPENANLSNMTWSDDQSKMAFINTLVNGNELWYLDINTKKCHKLSEPIINACISNVLEWTKDNLSILATTVVANQGDIKDAKLAISTGPTIMENDGKKAQNRTYQDLLKNAVDEYNFENLITSEITKFDLKGGSKLFKKAAMYMDMNFSPDGNYLMTYEIQKPFSYIVTYDRFPIDINLSSKDGQFITTYYQYPLTEDLPKGFMAVRKGKRSINWRADKAATLYWAEALDGGDPAVEVGERDAIYEQNAPFNGSTRLLVKTKERYGGIIWGDDQVAVIYERWWNTRNERILLFNPSDASATPVLFNQRNSQDNYADPGSFVTKRNQFHLNTLDMTDKKLYLLGEGFSPEGKFPFVDAYKLDDQKKSRLYHAKDQQKLEQLISAIDVSKGLYLTRLESKTEYPNYFIRNIGNGSLKQITYNPNPFKILDNSYKEVIKYQRPGGVELSATLYLPVGYDRNKKEKMPMIMWAYPTEYKDKNSASQVTSSANEFTFPYYGSPLYWLTKGYIVLDDASFPIVGEGDNEPNDTFIEQLVANAKAAIDAVDALGYVDRSRVAVGGHSYGAFMTANLLTHSDLFAAGIARSGAYNRTLTPFGFQSEERNYWEAPDVYDAMSPFQHADKMKHPLLMIHGEEDNNAGTHTMQSERYFNALKGLGATTRLVILPKESHGYSARESIMHMLWEQDQWLDKYVKNKKVDVKP